MIDLHSDLMGPKIAQAVQAAAFIEHLGRRGASAIVLKPGLVRLSIHGGVREREVETTLAALLAADGELGTADLA
jgi:hypothetical protein